MLSVPVESLEMSCSKPALPLGPPCADVNPEDLLTPFLLMLDFKKLKLLCIQCRLPISSLCLPRLVTLCKTLEMGFWGVFLW